MKRRSILCLLLTGLLCLSAAPGFAATLTLPSGLKVIEEEAFYGDMSLDEVVFPEGLERIESRAFADSSASLVHLSSTISFIDDEAFEGCRDMQATAPKGTYAYDWAQNKGIWRPADTPVSSFKYTVENGCVTINDFVGDETEVIVPLSIEGYPVTSIGQYAFMFCSDITCIILPDSVTSIGKSAFMSCKGLESIRIPDGVTSLGESAFGFCSSLKSISIPDSVTIIGKEAFRDCSGLISAELPDGIKTLGDYIFAACGSLNAIRIPDSVTTIGMRTFENCSSLTSVEMPDNLKSIGMEAFKDCAGLASIELPDSVTSISSGAFMNCNGLTSIAIPRGVTEIAHTCFSSCSSLRKVTIPGTHILYLRLDYTFENYFGSGVEEVIVLDGAAHIDDYAFRGCSSIKVIEISDGVTSIGSNALSYCSNLKNLIIPVSVTSIGGGNFGDGYGNHSDLKIYGKAGSYAEQYAAEKQIPFIAITFDENRVGVPRHYYEVLYTYSVGGEMYYQANLLREYHDVRIDSEEGASLFYLDSDYNVVTDPDILCELWTVNKCRNMASEMNDLMNSWTSAAQTCGKTAKDFVEMQALNKVLGEVTGSAVATALKSLYTGNPLALGDLAELAIGTASSGTVIRVMAETQYIDMMLEHLLETVECTSAYLIPVSEGVYEDARALKAIELYQYANTVYNTAQNWSMPIVENILQNYTSDIEVGLDNFKDICEAVIKSAATNSVCSMVNIHFDGVIKNNPESINTLSRLLYVISSDPVQWAASYIEESIAVYSDFAGSEVTENKELIAPFFISKNELLETDMYQAHIKLSQ